MTVTALLAKAIVLALKDYGAMNARYENGQLTEYDDVHLGGNVTRRRVNGTSYK